MAYRILLVEDDEQIREVITDYFASKDSVITIETASDGDMGLELLPKEYEILKYLMEHKDWVIARETLLTRVWGYDYYGGDRVVDNHIKNRGKLWAARANRLKPSSPRATS